MISELLQSKGTIQNRHKRGLQQLWNTHPNETIETFWNSKSACSGNSHSKRMKLERITDYYKQATHSGVRPVIKILQKMPNKQVFPLSIWKEIQRFEENQLSEKQEGPRWTNRTIDPGEYK